MQCFEHRDSGAIGLCKACQKALCAVCARDTGRGLACSDACAAEVQATNEIIDRSKQIYGIGRKSRMPATGILFYAFFAIAFLGFGIYPASQGRAVEWFLVIMGGGFLVIGIIAYVRTRTLRINC